MTLPAGWPGHRRKKLAIGLRKWPPSRLSGGGDGPPAAPSGYQLLLGADGKYLKGANGAYLYGVAQ